MARSGRRQPHPGQGGFLTGTALADVTNIAVNPTDPLAVDVTMSRPWTAFPLYLAGQIGLMASPAWLAASDADESLKSKPVGTGPFIFESYAPNESFKANRNPDYWNQPYPYLDSVEFRPIPARSTGGRAEERRHRHPPHDQRRDDRRVPRQRRPRARGAHLQGRDQLQPAARDPGTAGRHPVPLQDQRVRCALANAYDSETVIATINAGVDKLANGPFSPEQTGYLDDTGYPIQQDMDTAKQLISEYKVEHPGPLNLSLATTQDETNLVIAQFQKQWFEEAGVDSVTLDQIDQGNYIVAALLGNFQVFQWRNHSGVDMDQQYIWWHSSTALPVGQLALNFGRLKDPILDEALDANRARRTRPRSRATPRRSTSASPTSASTSGVGGRPGPSCTSRRCTSSRRSRRLKGSSRPRRARSPTCARRGWTSDGLSGRAPGGAAPVRGDKPRTGVVDGLSMRPTVPPRGCGGRHKFPARHRNNTGTRGNRVNRPVGRSRRHPMVLLVASLAAFGLVAAHAAATATKAPTRRRTPSSPTPRRRAARHRRRRLRPRRRLPPRHRRRRRPRVAR